MEVHVCSLNNSNPIELSFIKFNCRQRAKHLALYFERQFHAKHNTQAVTRFRRVNLNIEYWSFGTRDFPLLPLWYTVLKRVPIPHSLLLHLEEGWTVVANCQETVLTRLVHSTRECDLRAQRETNLLIHNQLDFHSHWHGDICWEVGDQWWLKDGYQQRFCSILAAIQPL